MGSLGWAQRRRAGYMTAKRAVRIRQWLALTTMLACMHCASTPSESRALPPGLDPSWSYSARRKVLTPLLEEAVARCEPISQVQASDLGLGENRWLPVLPVDERQVSSVGEGDANVTISVNSVEQVVVEVEVSSTYYYDPLKDLDVQNARHVAFGAPDHYEVVIDSPDDLERFFDIMRAYTSATITLHQRVPVMRHDGGLVHFEPLRSVRGSAHGCNASGRILMKDGSAHPLHGHLIDAGEVGGETEGEAQNLRAAAFLREAALRRSDISTDLRSQLERAPH